MIPVIMFLITGTGGRVAGTKSRPGIGVVRFNPIMSCALTYVPAPLIVIPLDRHRRAPPQGPVVQEEDDGQSPLGPSVAPPGVEGRSVEHLPPALPPARPCRETPPPWGRQPGGRSPPVRPCLARLTARLSAASRPPCRRRRRSTQSSMSACRRGQGVGLGPGELMNARTGDSADGAPANLAKAAKSLRYPAASGASAR